jgi:DNA-binding MarR family transcriptional regulator/GNAT superfamily N-acetyltransferase
MESAAIDQARRFHRTVTERIGALDERYLARDRPLGEARVLWEIGDDGVEVRTLRTRLGLDSGYLSRLLRSLEASGMATVDTGPGDRRVRSARLTEAGAAERAELDRLSDQLAWSLLEPLADEQRRQLIDAMATVERLLTAGSVDISVADPTSASARACLQTYFAELDERFDGGFDPDRSISADADELVEPAGLLLVARLRGQAIGCGALKLHGEEPADIKRMWVDRSARGLGLGRRLLAELERHAAARGVRVVRLDTNGALAEAISLYRSAGYREVEPFNDEPYAHHWFEKDLVADGG